MKIDCNVTENYLREEQRYIEKYGNILDIYKPKKKIEIIQAFSNANPQKTYLEDLLEKYPDAQVDKAGAPSFCPYRLYKIDEKCIQHKAGMQDCLACWNRIMEDKQ